MSVSIWVTLWVSDTQGCSSAVKMVKMGRVTAFAYFPKAAEGEAGRVHGHVQLVGVCLCTVACV